MVIASGSRLRGSSLVRMARLHERERFGHRHACRSPDVTPPLARRYGFRSSPAQLRIAATCGAGQPVSGALDALHLCGDSCRYLRLALCALARGVLSDRSAAGAEAEVGSPRSLDPW